MSETMREALQMICDPDLAGKTWPQVITKLRLDPDEDVPGDQYVDLQRACWIDANLARLVLSEDEAALARFKDIADPKRFIRDRIAKEAAS